MQGDVMVVSFEFAEGKNYGRYSFRGLVFGKEEKMGLMDACEEMKD
jgi:hypothetical protein